MVVYEAKMNGRVLETEFFPPLVLLSLQSTDLLIKIYTEKLYPSKLMEMQSIQDSNRNL